MSQAFPENTPASPTQLRGRIDRDPRQEGASSRSQLGLVLPGEDTEHRERRRLRLLSAEGVEVPTFPGSLPLLVPNRRRRHSLSYHVFEGPGWATLRLVSDLLAGVLAVVVALAVTQSAGELTLFAFPLLLAVAAHVRGLYSRRMRDVVLDSLGPLVGATSVAAMALLAYNVFVADNAGAADAIGRIWVIGVLATCGGRALLAFTKRRARATYRVGKPTLIVGAGHVGEAIARRLEDQPEYGLRPVGFLDADPLESDDRHGREIPVLGGPQDLRRVIAETGADHVILAFSHEPDQHLLALVRQCDELKVEVSLVPRLFESITDKVALERLGGLPLLGLRAIDPKGVQFRVKYALDRPLAALALVLLAPVMITAAIAVRVSSPGPIMFRQRRVGRDGKVFDLFKFRSMRCPEFETGFIPTAGQAPGGIEGQDRRTPVGRFLRRSAIDELPQLLNVVRGEMSLVGPRPERPEFVELFELDHARYQDRHRVKSGITGWAQVHGLRGQTSLADRVEWDNFYIENWSLWLDAKVFLMTASAVVRSDSDA